MNIEFIVGGLLVWLVFAGVLALAVLQYYSHPYADQTNKGRALRSCLYWPLILLAGLWNIGSSYVAECWDAYQTARNGTTDLPHGDMGAEPCLSIRERALIAYRFYGITPPEINRVLLNDVTLTVDDVFSARKKLDAANIPMFNRQLDDEQHRFLAYCG